MLVLVLLSLLPFYFLLLVVVVVAILAQGSPTDWLKVGFFSSLSTLRSRNEYAREVPVAKET